MMCPECVVRIRSGPQPARPRAPPSLESSLPGHWREASETHQETTSHLCVSGTIPHTSHFTSHTSLGRVRRVATQCRISLWCLASTVSCVLDRIGSPSLLHA